MARLRKAFSTIAVGLAGISGLLPGTARADLLDGIPVKGFWDISSVYDSQTKIDSFRHGAFDLFLAKAVDKQVNFLAELNFEVGDDNALGTDLERINIQYNVNPWFKVAAGRFHTALGYWNETYHHGTYLHTSVVRPAAVRFEDDGGLLPTHLVGLEFRGNGQVGAGNLGYIANIGNGRGSQKDPPQTFHDADRAKAFGGVVFYEFDNGLRFGSNIYFDTLPGGPALSGSALAAAPFGNEVIWGVNLIYNSPSIEFLNEAWWMQHTYRDGNPTSDMKLAYSQFGYHLNAFTPYVRYEVNLIDGPDAYLGAGNAASNPFTGNVRHLTGGLRYEVTKWSALKAEYEQVRPDGADSNYFLRLNWAVAL